MNLLSGALSGWSRLLFSAPQLPAVLGGGLGELLSESSSVEDHQNLMASESISELKIALTREHEHRRRIEESQWRCREAFLTHVNSRLTQPFRSFGEALSVLQTYAMLVGTAFPPSLGLSEQTRSVLDTYLAALETMRCSGVFRRTAFQESHRTVVVLEGASGVGKTTHLENLAGLLCHESGGLSILESGQRYGRATSFSEFDANGGADKAGNASLSTGSGSPQDEMVASLLAYLPPQMRRVVLFLELYRLAYMILTTINTRAVMLDEYYGAYLTASKTGCDSTNESDSVFQWPLDLPMPDLVIFMSCSSVNRKIRDSFLANVDLDVIVAEDKRCGAFHTSICGPPTVGLVTDDPVSETFLTMIEALDYFGVYTISRSIPFDAFEETAALIAAKSKKAALAAAPVAVPTPAPEKPLNSLDNRALPPLFEDDDIVFDDDDDLEITRSSVNHRRRRDGRRGSLALQLQESQLSGDALINRRQSVTRGSTFSRRI